MSVIKILVDTKQFKTAIEKSYKATAKSSTLQFLENIMLHIEKDNSYILGSNLENFAICKIDIPDISEKTQFFLSDTNSLIKAMKFFDSSSILLEIDGEKITLSCGNKKTSQKIVNDNLDPILKIPEFDYSSETTYLYNVSELKERFNLIKYAINESQNSSIKSGIHFDKNNLVATDSYRLALSKSERLYIEKSFTITANSVSLIIDVLEKNIVMKLSKKYIQVSDENSTIIIKLLNGEYFNYEKVIPEHGKELVVNVLEYLDILKYFKSFKSKKNIPLVAWKNERLNLINSGASAELTSIVGKFDQYIGFNNNYMLEALQKIKSDETKIIIENSFSPIVIQPDENYLAIVLPCRLKEEDIEDK